VDSGFNNIGTEMSIG